MTTIVYILTNIHAAVNFGQYAEYTYPPNMPFRLAGKPPTSKVFSRSLLARSRLFVRFCIKDNVCISHRIKFENSVRCECGMVPNCSKSLIKWNEVKWKFPVLAWYAYSRFSFSCRISKYLSLIHIWRCRRSTLCRSRWSPDH